MAQTKEQNHLEQRIDGLESQLAFQEDTIEALNKQVEKQAKEIDLLRRHLELVATKVAPIVERSGIEPFDANNERPPHY
ncbi:MULTISPECIES: SlyX family protein [Gammaproteobacteria]|uniref:SlyX family protein n=1 Tax=Gammaproteobacteria TaxID=1236 RepID=UPI000DD0AE9B|nr:MULTISPECIES: SlyX family protein [Gammaproteobacteria]RTE85712.1 SlyX family protein [Aliidiomarina sp. B3213]TCZ90288.1 SlyX family protein [Lysobacter sp. N42]